MDHLNKLVRKDLVIGLPKLCFKKSWLCDVCQKVKQVKASYKSKNGLSTNWLLQLFHVDFFCPSKTKSFGRNMYSHVVVDDYSLYTGTLFLSQKRDMFGAFQKLARII